MKFVAVIIFVLLIHHGAARHPKRQPQRNKSHRRHQNKPVTTAPLSESYSLPRQRYVLPSRELAEEPAPQVEVDTLKCPLGCVCQYAHFMDLPISRWIRNIQLRPPIRRAASADGGPEAEDLINENEVAYDADESYLTNPFIKQATCILQEDNDADVLVNSLPHDLQALILLYTGIGKMKMVNTSTFLPLNQLSTLEIRGPQDLMLRLIFDKPLSFLQHANFDSITLIGSETFERPTNPIHPSESFDYKPLSETEDLTDEPSGTRKVQHKKPEKQNIIVPYDIYKEEMLKAEMQRKKSQMPTFYGWDHLEVLRIRGCALKDLDWEMFDGLESLQHLSLERNGITEVPPFALYGVMHIKTLSLAHNNITRLHYRDLAGLLELENLDLSDNRLTQLSELSFPPFPKLEYVDFRNNPIHYIFPATFWVMNTTRSMFFHSRDVPLELWPDNPFESLVEMKELSIGNVTINVLEQNVFKGLKGLEKLTLKGRIRSIEFDAFSSLSELREVDLSECQVQEISMDMFVGCKQLHVINLARNNISYIPPGLFDELNLLEEIYLEGNQLRTLPTNFFLQPKLRLARLTDNPWKCSCDMFNWLPKITNQERGARVERCITDYFTGKKISCRTADNFKFNHRYAPRCANFNQRSVFYVIRKQMQCGPGRVVRSGKTRVVLDAGQGPVPTWRKIELLQQQQQQLPQEKNRVANMTQGNRFVWQLQREHKIRRTRPQQRNSLEYVLQQSQKAYGKTQLSPAHLENDTDAEMSNRI